MVTGIIMMTMNRGDGDHDCEDNYDCCDCGNAHDRDSNGDDNDQDCGDEEAVTKIITMEIRNRNIS